MSNINLLKENFLKFITGSGSELFRSRISEDQWYIITKWCIEHRLTYVFVSNIVKSKISRSKLTSDHFFQLEKKANRAPLRQLKIKANLFHLHRVLSENSIDYKVLKGPILAFKYYDDSKIRRMRDIDIIVKPQSFMRACELLVEHGYSFDSKESSRIDFSACLATEKHAPHLVHPDFNIVIEVHHRISKPSQKEENHELSLHPDFWQLPDYIILGNEKIPCESPEMLLAHIILHSVRENVFNNGPVFLFDLYYLIKNSHFCWNKFYEYSDYMGLNKEVEISLTILLYFYPEVILHGSFKPVSDKKLISACNNLMLRDLEQMQYERLSSALQTKKNRERLSHIKGLLLPTEEKLRKHLNMKSSRIYWLNIPILWCYLLKIFISQYFFRNKKMTSTNELKILYRWLSK